MRMMLTMLKNILYTSILRMISGVLFSENNVPLREFLRARNPKQQHSATLESYLIKPIQRILKYPLLLRQLKELTDTHTDEHHHLTGQRKTPIPTPPPPPGPILHLYVN